MSIGAALAIAAGYAAYSGAFYVIDWLFAHGHDKLAVLATLSFTALNWIASALVTSGHPERVGNILWLLFGAVVPFLGGAGLVCFGQAAAEQKTGLALMFGTLLPVLMFLYLHGGRLKEFLRGTRG